MHCVRSQKNLRKRQKKLLFNLFFHTVLVYSSGLFGSTDLKFVRDKIITIRNNIPNSLAKGHRDIKPDIKRNWKFSHLKNDGKGRMRSLLLPYFSDCKNRRIKQKTNLAASKMKFFCGIS